MAARKYLLAAFLLLGLLLAAITRGQNAPGAPGMLPTWTPGSKEAVGTANSTDSHVWFTLEGGILTEVYYPGLDTADVRTLEFVLSDGKKIWIDSRDLLHSIERINENALTFRQTSRDPEGQFALTKTYITDPQRDTLLIDVGFSGPPSAAPYVLYDPSLKNSGYGDTGKKSTPVWIGQVLCRVWTELRVGRSRGQAERCWRTQD
jgi:glucoamylase